MMCAAGKTECTFHTMPFLNLGDGKVCTNTDDIWTKPINRLQLAMVDQTIILMALKSLF